MPTRENSSPARGAKKPAGTPVDWSAVRTRLEQAAIESKKATDSPEAERALLIRRARELARPLAVAVAAEATIEVVAFELGGQVFGVEAAQVKEAVIPRDLTALPGMPPRVRGLVNVRSRVVPTFDLKPLLQLRAPAGPPMEKLLIVVCEATEFGLLVERVLGLREVATLRLRADVPGLDQKYLRGITDDGLILLDLAALLPDLAVDDSAEL